MDRLMVVKLVADGCAAEAWLNGLPMARVGPLAPQAMVAAHEAVLEGPNRLELLVSVDGGAATPPAAPHDMAAHAHLLLPRLGAAIDEGQARTLADVAWSCAAGERLALPTRQRCDAELPIRFPRWRWLDAPVLQPSPALAQHAYDFVAGLGRDLARGQTAGFLEATRLRTEELAAAYQRSAESETARLREWLEHLYASQRLVWRPLAPQDMQTRLLAGGRLLECLGADGRAALTTMPDKEGAAVSLPLRLSLVEGRFYVLR